MPRVAAAVFPRTTGEAGRIVSMDSARLRAARDHARETLLAARNEEGHWSGELSSSALATATAVNAVMTNAQSRVELIARQFAETGVKELMNKIYELLLKLSLIHI